MTRSIEGFCPKCCCQMTGRGLMGMAVCITPGCPEAMCATPGHSDAPHTIPGPRSERDEAIREIHQWIHRSDVSLPMDAIQLVCRTLTVSDAVSVPEVRALVASHEAMYLLMEKMLLRDHVFANAIEARQPFLAAMKGGQE